MPAHTDEDPSQPQDEQPTPAPGEAGELPESVGHQARARALRIGAAATLIAVVVAVIATSGGGSSANLASGHSTTAGITALLAGIPQSGNTLGSPTAPVTLQYFGDLECSTARAFTLAALPLIIRKWVRPGKLRIEYRSLRTVSQPNVFGDQQVAALAAGRQDKLWYYLEDFYHEQGREHSGYVTEGYLRALARQVPHLNLELWSDNRQDPQLAAQVAEDEQVARAAHMHSTPSFLVGRTGSAAFRSLGGFSALDPTTINNAVRQILHSQPNHPRHAPPTSASVGSGRSHQHTASIAQRDRLSTSTGARSHDISDIAQTPTVRR